MTLIKVTEKDPQKLATIFCDYCLWVCKCWSINHAMFEHSDQDCYKKFISTPEGEFLKYFFEISSPHFQLAMAKLHDRAVDPNNPENENLSIEFFTMKENWADNEWKKIKRLKGKLYKFYESSGFPLARTKMHAHLDMNLFKTHYGVIKDNPASEIDTYFKHLGQLVKAIANKWDCNLSTYDFDWSPEGELRDHYRENARYIIDVLFSKHFPRFVQSPVKGFPTADKKRFEKSHHCIPEI